MNNRDIKSEIVDFWCDIFNDCYEFSDNNLIADVQQAARNRSVKLMESYIEIVRIINYF